MRGYRELLASLRRMDLLNIGGGGVAPFYFLLFMNAKLIIRRTHIVAAEFTSDD
jgi:hypothetical protein